MTPETFRTAYPEFRPVADATLLAHLAEASARVADTWGDAREEVIGLETAHRLAISPQGRAANLVSKDGTSTYGRELRRRQDAHACLLGRLGVF